MNTELQTALAQSFSPREIEVCRVDFRPCSWNSETTQFVGDVYGHTRFTVASGREIADAIKSIGWGDAISDDVLLTGQQMGAAVRWRWVDYNVATDTTEGPLRVVVARRKYGADLAEAYPS